MNKTIYINGRFLTKPVMGVFRYAFELLSEFDTLLEESRYKDIAIVCLVPPELSSSSKWKNITTQKIGKNKGNIWEQIDLPWYANGKLLFSPANSGPLYYSNHIVTIHDASVFKVPAAYTALFRAKYFFLLRNLARKARQLITISVFSQEELSECLGVPANRFQVILEGGDHLSDIVADEGCLQRFGLKQNSYILSVASQSRHKNFDQVLYAAEAFNPDIVFAAAGGNYNSVFQKVSNIKVPANVRLLGYVTDSELKALYKNAIAFIFPSTYEGFGLPLLEAMNMGCPVLSSNVASMPEIGGEAVLYFDPLNGNDLVGRLREFFSNANLRENLKILGRKQAENFTWEKTARETLDLLESNL